MMSGRELTVCLYWDCGCNFPELARFSFFFYFGLDWQRIAYLCILLHLFAHSSERGYTAHSDRDGSSDYGPPWPQGIQAWTSVDWLLLVFLCGIKLSMLEIIHSEMREAVLGGPPLKRAEWGVSVMYDLNHSKSALLYIVLCNDTPEEIFGFALTLTKIKEVTQGRQHLCKHWWRHEASNRSNRLAWYLAA